MIDHLFRHQYGKMVSILTRIFGLAHLETIEDAVQDTFVTASLSWRNQIPDNPEAWLTQAAKNRTIDLFRKFNAEKKRVPMIESGAEMIAMFDLFLDNEIEDSQLRMIFAACHPALNPKDQIAFSLKTISGFSSSEIASALLLKEETVKKRLTRARKVVQEQNIEFAIPQGKSLPKRLDRVLEVLYLIFNEGFHSTRRDMLVRKELCGEAMRLCEMLLKNTFTRSEASYALFALMCFHAARLDSKVSPEGDIIDIKNQDRSLWFFPMVELGNDAMNKAVESGVYTGYHYEAAIASIHHQASTFALTNWDALLHWYQKLYELEPSDLTLLNMASIFLQKKELNMALQILEEIDPKKLEQRAYLYYGTYAEYFYQQGSMQSAISHMDQALGLVKNEAEKKHLEKKRNLMLQ
ncbi:MAG: RNA polymerase sigma factor [Bacteroidia bacterium]